MSIFGCNRYFWQHETLSSKTNVFHQILQLFILLNYACVLFIDIYMCKIIYKSTHMVHSFIIHRFFQCIFANCCYRFQPFFVHRFFHRVFQRCLSSNFLKICSQVFSQGFSEVSVEQFLENLFTGFFTGFFTGLF